MAGSNSQHADDAPRHRRRPPFWRKIPEKLLSSRFNVYQAVMGVGVAYVVYRILIRFL
jgi:hypothetical protein